VLVVARLAGVASAQRRAQSEQERLLGRVVEASEHERIRIARDVSDGPIQKLGTLALRLDLLANQLSTGDLAEASASTRPVRDDQIVLSIRDDGRGFAASRFVRNPESCLGLTSMDDLARSVAGTMRVTSGRGAGTEVRVRIPLDRPGLHGSELSQVTSLG